MYEEMRQELVDEGDHKKKHYLPKISEINTLIGTLYNSSKKNTS